MRWVRAALLVMLSLSPAAYPVCAVSLEADMGLLPATLPHPAKRDDSDHRPEAEQIKQAAVLEDAAALCG